MSLLTDGSAKNAAQIHPISGTRKNPVGFFEVSFLTPDNAKVMLREEGCFRAVGLPRRRSRQLALLRPWKPVRVLLNGRSGSYAGQHYALREYYFVLCTDPTPDRVGLPRFVDLQADLF